MNYGNLKTLSMAALGRKPAGLALKNANVVNVFSEEILLRDIAIEGGMIVGVGDYAGREEVDLGGKYVCPGFIDGHLHFESTLVTPPELVAEAMKWGTTTFIVDPHEAVNVAGEAGLDYILGQIADLAANVFVMLPSCVPAAAGEDNGCTFSAARMRRYLRHPRVLGLGEVMDYTAVTEADPDMLEKLDLFRDRPKDGHAPLLEEKRLAAYALAKIGTDHECMDYAYALREVRNGLQVLIREGSGARNVEAIVKGIVADGMDTSRFGFCTDDKHIEDIRREGHISHNVKKSIRLGIAPVKAIKMATINTARHYRLGELGAVAPGYRADLVVLDSLEDVAVHAVYCGGEKQDFSRPPRIKPCPEALRNTVRVAPVGAEQIRLPAGPGENAVIEMVAGQIATRRASARLPAANGFFVPDATYNKAVAVERHNTTGRIGVAPVAGFNLKGGAVASSVSHDSHNLVAVGDNDDGILLALREIVRVQGGYTLVRGGAVVETLPLPIMGLMSDAGHETLERALGRMIRHAHEMGVPANTDPFIALSFLALPVLPEIRVTTRGLYDVVAGKLV